MGILAFQEFRATRQWQAEMVATAALPMPMLAEQFLMMTPTILLQRLAEMGVMEDRAAMLRARIKMELTAEMAATAEMPPPPP
jgi:hypothetical protein